jgi:hypothetical protein
VGVRVGRETRVDAELSPADRPGSEIVAAQVDRTGLDAGGAGELLPEWTLSGLPHARRESLEAARILSRADALLGVEGLPGWMTALSLDGFLFRPASLAHSRYAALGGVGFGLSGAAGAELVATGADVEWSGAAGGWLSLHSPRGTPGVEGKAMGAWTGSVLPGPSFGNDVAWNNAQASALIRGGSAGNQGRVAVGVDIQRLETPFSRSWGDSPAAVTLAGFGNDLGVDFAALRRSDPTPLHSVSAFARGDIHLGSAHRLGASLQFASQPKLPVLDPRIGTLQELKARDVVAGATLASEFSALDRRLTNDFRVGLTASSRTSAGVAGAHPSWIVGDGLGLGGPTTPARAEETRLQLSNALHIGGRRHRVKVGAGVELADYMYDHRLNSAGEYYFGSVDDVLARRGFVVRSLGPAPRSEWQTATPFAFLQNRWLAAPGLDILAGVRASRSTLPTSGVGRDEEWLQLSGLANDAVRTHATQVEIRAEVLWDLAQNGRTTLFASGGTFRGEIDPLLLNEWRTDAGSGRVRREYGTLSWPIDPPSGAGYRRLTMLGPDFSAPVSARGTVGLSLLVGEGTMATVSANVRRTEKLPRRVDLNRIPSSALRDQYGRDVFGTLQMQGALLYAEPGTGRRFAGYDEVAGINTDGVSTYRGIDLGIYHASARGAVMLGRYTFSRTTDNWFAGREGGWTVAAPRPQENGVDWAQGTSDFDAPHRLTAAMLLPLPLSARLGVVYRGESGLPFTPGFRRGVDADGDGYMGNDPAFIDPALPGMSELIGQWSCLADSRDSFAARNSCRASARHSLDLGLGIDVLRWGSRIASVHVDAFDLFESAAAVPDAALYLLDPAGTLQTDAAGRTVSTPLQVNSEFGSSLVRPHAGRQIRLGISIKW